MSQTSSERRTLLVPMRWSNAGGNLARPNHIHHDVVRSPMPSEPLLKCPGHSPASRACQTSRGHRAGAPPTTDLGANVKSP
jgi:hypothetical protein